jgi:hypothetical protein
MKRASVLALALLVGIPAGANRAFAQVVVTFGKAFGDASIPLNGTTSLRFVLGALSNVIDESFNDALPPGLVVATPNGLNVMGGCHSATVTATPGSSSVSLSGATFGAGDFCAVFVNVTGTSPGLKNNSVAETANSPPSIATASLAVGFPGEAGQELESYFSNANTTGGQAFINITAPLEGNETATNPAVNQGETCAMIYGFDTAQNMQVCCGCPITADGLLTLQISTNLAPNPVGSSSILMDGSIRILSTLPNSIPGLPPGPDIFCDPATSVCCDPAASLNGNTLTPASELVAWASHVQNSQITESEFLVTNSADPPPPEEPSDRSSLPEACAEILALGTGSGVCTCPFGDPSLPGEAPPPTPTATATATATATSTATATATATATPTGCLPETFQGCPNCNSDPGGNCATAISCTPPGIPACEASTDDTLDTCVCAEP